MPRGRPSKATSTPQSTPLKNVVSPPSSASTLRQSTRVKSSPITATQSKTTPKKSRFFEHESDPSEPSEPGVEDSGYEDEDASVSAASSLPVSEEEVESEEYASEEDNSKKRKRGKKSAIGKVVGRVMAKGKELWRPGVKSDLEPGKEIFIKLPKAREAGSVKYQDGTIHPNTMLFLGELKQNNDRQWLKIHDADYRQSQRDWDSFVENLTEKIIEKDETIPELPPKDLTFRIYRDVRFSSDPTPYKTHFSAAWSRTGRKGPYAAYYVQIKPGGSFVGSGLWMPEAAPLAQLRTAIDRRPKKLMKVLLNPAIRKELLGGISADEAKAVEAFAGQNKENALKTKPKGYDADHPNIALLRLRNFTMGRQLKDSEVTGKGGLDKIIDLFGTMTPFVTYLNSIVMPDDEGSSEDEGAESDVEDEVE